MTGGIEAIPFRVPEVWDPKWFLDFIRDALAPMDVRNALGIGITITGAPATVATLKSDFIGDSFIVISASSNLTNERVLAGESGVITITDNGAGLTVVIGVAANGITFAKMQQIATSRILGRTTAATGDIEALTGTQATTLLDDFVGDSGSGGTKGSVPAPAAGDTAADKFLSADGTFSAIQNATTGVKGLVNEAVSVADLSQTISDPPTQTEVQNISDKMDEFFGVARTAGLLV